MYRTPWDTYQSQSPPPMLRVPDMGDLPPEAAGSGLNDQYRASANWQGSNTSNTARYMSPAELQGLVAGVRQLQPIQEQEQSQAANRELLRSGLSRPPMVDLATPLANLSDYVATGRLGSRQAADPGAEYGKLRDYAAKLQDDQRDLSNTILKGATTAKLGYDVAAQRQQQMEQMTQGAADPLARLRGGSNPEDINYHKWVTRVDADPILKKTPEAIKGISDARHMLDTNSPVDASNFRFALLKGLGVGRITDYELKGEQGSRALWDKLDQMIERLQTGKLTESNKKDYIQLLDGILESQRGMYEQTRQYHLQRGMQGYRLPKNRVEAGVNSMQPSTGWGKVPTGAVQTGAPSPASPAAATQGDAGMDAFLRSQGKR